MRDNFGTSLLEAKSAFEHLCGTFQVRFSGYHGDNGWYADVAFRQDIIDNNQSCIVHYLITKELMTPHMNSDYL